MTEVVIVQDPNNPPVIVAGTTIGPQGSSPVITAASTTGQTLGYNSKSWTVPAGLAFVVGQYVRISENANPLRYMAGPITSYSDTTLTVNVQEYAGTGGFGASTISLTGVKGAAGSGGGGGGTGYTHNQSVPNSTWSITHNLGYFPNATVVASSGDVIEGDTTWTSVNTMTITFSGAFSGVAYLS